MLGRLSGKRLAIAVAATTIVVFGAAYLWALDETRGVKSPADRSEQAAMAQAHKCDLKAERIQWTTRENGERWANVIPDAEADDLGFAGLACMLRWAQETGAKVGFTAEPPPDALRDRR